MTTTSTKKAEYQLPPLRERIDHYSYAGKESIGKGFSSSVFKGRDDTTGTANFIQMRMLPLK